MPSKLLRVRMAVVAGLVTLSIGGMVAAATGLASAPAERAATLASSRASGARVAHEQGDAAKTHGPSAAAATNSSGPTRSDHVGGPDASGAARRGLCQAWNAGQGGDHGKRADAPAFRALAAAAGGVDRIPAYCRAELDAATSQGRRPAAPPGGSARTSPVTTGPPQDPGQGEGQGNGQGSGHGGPPTTT
jgi:hypothetical protein